MPRANTLDMGRRVGRSLAGAQGASEEPQRIAHRPAQMNLLNPRSRVGAGKQPGAATGSSSSATQSSHPTGRRLPMMPRSITEHSLQALSRSQGAGDLMRLYLFAKRDGAEFNLAAVPFKFREKSSEPFDRRYMRALFDVGFRQARGGCRWLWPAPALVAVRPR